MAQQLSHMVGAEPLAPEATDWDAVYNPALGTVIGEVPLNDERALDLAVKTAEAAFPKWAKTPVLERARIMFRYHELLVSHREELAALVTQEHGKVRSDAYSEVGRGIEVVQLAAAAPSLLKGEVLPGVSHGVDVFMMRVPLGVVAGITPFNFPAMIPLWMIPLALVSGNAFVLKPSERTPLTALRLAELFYEAGLPPGVLNVVHGGRTIVERLLSHPGIRAISFVGSQPVAQHVYSMAATNGKRVQALGGAKNFHVVLPDADLERTVQMLTSSAYGSAGERCLAGSVVVAVGDAGDRLVEAMQARIRRLVVGNGSEPESEMGPLIRAQHRERVVSYIDRGVREGAQLVYDGRAHAVPTSGFFLGPTLFDRVSNNMAIAREEIFGPVLSIIHEPSLEAAVKTANQSRFGNTTTLYTRSGAAARYYRENIQAGMVGINVGVAAPVAWFPFSGWKDSFYGDLHATGSDGFTFYTERQVVTERWD